LPLVSAPPPADPLDKAARLRHILAGLVASNVAPDMMLDVLEEQQDYKELAVVAPALLASTLRHGMASESAPVHDESALLDELQTITEAPPSLPPAEELSTASPAPQQHHPEFEKRSGLWVAQSLTSGVAELRGHLQQHWKHSSCFVAPRVPDLLPYDGYEICSDPGGYSEAVQKTSTLRPSGSKRANLERTLKVMPGLEVLEKEVSTYARSVAQELQPGVNIFLWVFHILKQEYNRDCGSGFGVHTDTADDAPAKRRNELLVSVAVKLTQDPEGSEGSWMQVVGHGPVKYGSEAGATLVFQSNVPHQSLRTPIASGEILKIVFFYMRGDAPAI
jgi:hypothetical protein